MGLSQSVPLTFLFFSLFPGMLQLLPFQQKRYQGTAAKDPDMNKGLKTMSSEFQLLTHHRYCIK